MLARTQEPGCLPPLLPRRPKEPNGAAKLAYFLSAPVYSVLEWLVNGQPASFIITGFTDYLLINNAPRFRQRGIGVRQRGYLSTHTGRW